MIHSSMRLRLVVLAAAALVMVFGFTTMDSMPLDALPEFSRPYVEVQTEALGLSADEVEAMITTPLEADMLNGTPWVEEVRSQSIPGLSSIVLVFKKGTDLMRARQMVQERLTQIFALPSVSKPPVMINPRSSASRVMEIGLSSESLSLIEMSVLARWTIVPRLMGLPGVANVSIWGQRQRQLQVQVDPEKLREKGITLMQIISTSGNALWSSPLSFLEASTPGTGGWIDTPNQRLGVRHLLPITTAEDLAKVTVDGATSMRLGDVATVVEDHQPLIGDAIVKDEPSLMLVVDKFPWANTTEVTEEVEIALADLSPGLTGLEMDSTLFRPATFLELAMNNFATALLIGAALALVVLFLFLSHWRGALIAGIAVFASAMAALTVLYLRGAELNLMVFAGLMLALSAVVDDAIVGVDAISRRLREARTNGNGGSRASLIAEAAIESRGPLFYATVILVLVVLPVFFLEGLSGAFLQPLVLSYLLALLASMLVALTVTPALSVMFSQSKGDSPASQTLGTIYDGLFSWAAKTPRMAFIAVLVMACGFLALPVVRQETLLPALKETDLVVRFQGNPSASHPAMNRITRLAGRELRAIPGVRNVSAHVGRAIMSDQRTNVDGAELWVSIDPTVDYDATVSAVKEVVAGYPGLSREVLTYLQAKFREELSGTGESLVVRVYGEDMGIIRQKANEVRDIMASIDGIVDPTVQFPREMPILEIEVDLEKAKPYGLKPGDVRRAATSIVSGVEVGALFEEQKVFEVVVQGVPNTRHSLTSIQNLLVDTPSGGHVRLQDVADVRIVPGPAVIHRDAVARRMDVTA
ncbi:MAG TPA: efflux RND transporter permease subunit, partial [Vicinamibacteria bacterium]|nr:efflux RND transporter permease subunit [Vicinamibacteria bacterium]